MNGLQLKILKYIWLSIQAFSCCLILPAIFYGGCRYKEWKIKNYEKLEPVKTVKKVKM